MKKPDPEKIDRDNPEWTDAEFRRAKPAAEVLPASVHAMLGIRRRGPQKTPTKQVVTIRLSPDVVEAFKASGTGWQTRVDAALRDWLKTHQPG
ncbi:BrnA antitoxin family protein [Bordetella bronchiseptica]|uniref:BrnA antitoxin family protein n=1 Tax=Bordetella bronchiseptica TaxID=518 RepID=UPI00053B67AA|nr:BrnA antitoxin family protein [Bordetella bronchiseptica]QIX99160.1 BrnA antitoxin family protein [Bordetella bronchiseptica]